MNKDDCPELYLIATAPGHQKKGYGKSLVSEGLRRLANQHYTGCHVKTASADARRFYEKLGFRVMGVEHRGKRQLHMLFKAFELEDSNLNHDSCHLNGA